jgi:hypothetical protein
MMSAISSATPVQPVASPPQHKLNPPGQSKAAPAGGQVSVHLSKAAQAKISESKIGLLGSLSHFCRFAADLSDSCFAMRSSQMLHRRARLD